MEVVRPSSPTGDFDFGSARLSPSPINYLSAPSSPRRFGQCFLSAPTSPTRISELYRQFDDFNMAMEMERTQNRGGRGPSCSVSAVPFDWEEKPGTPKSAAPANDDYEFDFAFDVSVELDKGSRSAEELFSGGKIRPLKPPPRLQLDDEQVVSQRTPLIPSPRSPKSPIAQGKKLLRDVFSPRRKKQSVPKKTEQETEQNRGRDRTEDSLGRRATRSLSPFRVSGFSWEEESQNHHQQKHSIKQSSSSSNQKGALTLSNSSSSSKGSSKRWSFKDFLLFRSASEGRGTDKDPLRKYTVFKKQELDVKNSSFRSTESTGSRRRVSAHELHYAANRAASEDLKKKTFLPYKQGILGRLAFNPAVHALANGFGSLGR